MPCSRPRRRLVKACVRGPVEGKGGYGQRGGVGGVFVLRELLQAVDEATRVDPAGVFALVHLHHQPSGERARTRIHEEERFCVRTRGQLRHRLVQRVRVEIGENGGDVVLRLVDDLDAHVEGGAVGADARENVVHLEFHRLALKSRIDRLQLENRTDAIRTERLHKRRIHEVHHIRTDQIILVLQLEHGLPRTERMQHTATFMV